MPPENLTIKRSVYTAACLALSVVLRLVLGPIPNVDAVFCPLHLPVLLCGYACGPLYGLLCGFLAPLLGWLVCSLPSPALLVAVTAECCVCGFLMGLLTGRRKERPGKNAFLTSIYCVIVPFLACPFTKTRPDRYNITAAFMSILGITMISVTGNDFTSVCFGDVLTLLGGIFYSFHMVAVSVFSQNRNVLILTMLQFLFAGIIVWFPALATETIPAYFPPSGIAAILYLAVFATGVCYIFQNTGQKYTAPSTASLILSLEAVFGVLFSVIFTSETVSPKVFAGFALVFIAILISEIKPKLSKRN